MYIDIGGGYIMHNSGLRCRVSALPILVVYLIVALTCAARGASQDDPYYAKDLLAARSDEHYKNLSDLEAVRIYRLHRESALFRECDRRYVGALDCTITEITALEMAKAAKAANKSVNAQTAASTPPSMAINAGVAKVASTAALGAGSDAAAAKTTASPTANSSQIIPFIRHDFPDISLFAALTPAGNATGAQLSYSSDRAGNNDSWSLYGVGGVAYQLFGGYLSHDQTTLLGAYIAPYVSTNWLFNSSASQKSKQSDLTSSGAKMELGVGNLLGGDQYFRIGGAGTFDGLGNTESTSAEFEWIPVYDVLIHHPQAIPNTGVIYRFDPELIVQYDTTTNSKKPLLFSNRDDSLRIGPQLTLNIFGNESQTPILSNLNAKINYHFAEELYSAKLLHYFETDLTYNLDQAGNVGITGSYQYGSDEISGKYTNLFKLGLSGKY